MGINNIWVFAQEANGAPPPATLELLTKARSLGGTVSAFVVGDGAAIASALGEYGAAKVYSTGALDGDLPGVGRRAAPGIDLGGNLDHQRFVRAQRAEPELVGTVAISELGWFGQHRVDRDFVPDVPLYAECKIANVAMRIHREHRVVEIAVADTDRPLHNKGSAFT